MNIVSILVSVALAAGAAYLQDKPAQAPAPAAQPAAAPAVSLPEHPTIRWDDYPRWSCMDGAAVVRDWQFATEQAARELDSLRSVDPETAGFDRVFLPFSDVVQDIMTQGSVCTIMADMMGSEDFRKAQEQTAPQTAAFISALTSDSELWEKVKLGAAQPWVKELSPAKQRFVQQIVDAFRESGADLPPEKKARKQELDTRGVALQLEYNKRLAAYRRDWFHVFESAAELEGMPAGWLQMAAEAAQDKGYGTPQKPQYLVDFDMTADVLVACANAQSRKVAWEGRQGVGCGKYDTAALAADILKDRQEAAELLGFKNFADLATCHNMIDSGEKALAFVNDLIERLKPAFAAENKAILDFASKKAGKQLDRLDPWDAAYYAALYRDEKTRFDYSSLCPYFEQESVIKGMFGIASTLYGVQFREIPTACIKHGQPLPAGKVEVWHPEVRLFAVHDAKTGTHLGSVYMDLYPRTGKRDGACMAPISIGKPAAGGKPHGPHLVAVFANFGTAHAAGKDMLFHYDVQTLFHEFGHALHAILLDCELPAHSSDGVACDFSELPSMLNEEWASNPEALATFARHFQTGKPLPDRLLKKLQEVSGFLPASESMAQLGVARLDLEMHMHYREKFQGKDLDAVTAEIMRDTEIPQTAISRSLIRDLPHCIEGAYAAGYYSYIWAEVLVADLWVNRFLKDGVLNPATGAAYRECILSKGDSKSAHDLYRDFMGRDPKADALLRKKGLEK